MNNKEKPLLKWIMILVVLVLFSTFLFLKIHGHFDFTSRFDIQAIECREKYNRVLLIDNDRETTWGMLDQDHIKGEVIDIQFRRNRRIGRVVIYNNSDSPNPPIMLYTSNDGEQYSQCLFDERVNEGYVEYILDSTYEAKYLRIENCSDEEGNWPVTEMQIYE